MRHARIVDEDIDLAEGHQRGGGQLIDAGIARDIDVAGLLVQLAGQRFGTFEIDIGDQDAGALFDELAHDAGAEARRAAGDDGGLAL